MRELERSIILYFLLRKKTRKKETLFRTVGTILQLPLRPDVSAKSGRSTKMVHSGLSVINVTSGWHCLVLEFQTT